VPLRSAYFAAMTTVLRSVLALAIAVVLSGCASSPPAPAPRARPSSAAITDVRRVVVVTTGESRFTVMQDAKEPGRAFDDVMKWLPYKDILAPIARAVYSGISWLIDADRAAGTVPGDVVPGTVVAEAFARALQVSGPFNQIVPLDREPVGDERRLADAIVRLTVPSWGLMRVREGDPDMVAGFADVRAQMVLRETGVVVWEHEEDVTHPGRLSLDAFKRDRALTRQELVDVLERAGRRLANELVYARDGGR
jgi:hypothetical protein